MEQKRGGINIEKALQTELMTALNEMFYAILCVKPEEDTVLILQSSEHPCSAQQKLSWTEYLGRYSGILTEESYRKVKERFSSEALLASSRKGERSFTLDASYLKEGKTNWLTASALVKEQPDGWTIKTADGKLSAHFEHTIAITPKGPVILTQQA